MNEQANPQTKFDALTDEELEQVNGGYKVIPGKKPLPPNFLQDICSGKHCERAWLAFKSNRVCNDCPYAN